MYQIDKTPAADLFEFGRKKIADEFANALRYKEDTFEKTAEVVYELKQHVEFSRLPEFIYPVVTKVKNDTVVIMDSRAYFNAHGEPVNAQGYVSAKNLALMSCAFETNHRDFMGVAPTVSMVFANWISGITKQIYSLDVTQEESLKVMLAFFYTQRILNKSAKDSLDYSAKYIVDAIKLPADFVYGALEVLGESDEMTGLDELFKAFAEQHGLHNFKMSEQLARELAAKASWFGDRAAEYVALSIDYPPALVQMIAASVDSNLFKRTKIGTIVDNLRRNRKLNFDLVRSLTKELLADYGA